MRDASPSERLKMSLARGVEDRLFGAHTARRKYSEDCVMDAGTDGSG